jgi:signal transduction histidine kinase/ligand-binding sensor domain-containing protein
MPSIPKHKIFFTGVFMLFMAACKNTSENIPFPYGETEFAQPVSRPFKFAEPEKINWIISNPDSFKNITVKHFDFDKLPSKPFNIGTPVPLRKTMEESKLNWDSLPDTVFNLKDLPTQPLQFKTSILGNPQIVKAGSPYAKNIGTRGLMQFGIEQGLPGANSRFFLPDKNGTLWIATERGICHFDGVNYEIYAASQGLNDNIINTLAWDKAGRLWAGTDKGEVYVIDIKRKLLKQLTTKHGKTVIITIREVKDGQVWITTNGSGAYIIDPQAGSFKQFGPKQGLHSNFVVDILQDRNGLIWIGENGLDAIDLKKGILKRIRSGIVFNLMQEPDGDIWFLPAGSDNQTGGLSKLSLNNGTIKHIATTDLDERLKGGAVLTSFLKDKKGKLWISTNTGIILVFDEKAGTIEKLDIVPGFGNFITKMFEDSQGQTWIGTIASGSYIINHKDGRPGNFSKAQGLGDKNVWGLKEDSKERIWIGTYDGIDVFDPKTQTIKHMGTREGLSMKRSDKFIEDKHGAFLIAGIGNGLDIIDIDKKTLEHIGNEQGLRNNSTSGLMEDKLGQIWLSSFNGEIYVINREKKIIKKISGLPEIGNNRITTLYQDKQGRIWAGIIGSGMYLIDPEKNIANHLTTNEGLSSDDFGALLEDSLGRFWIASERGIDIADLKKGTLTSITTQEGLTGNGVYSLLAKNGRVYVGTGNGLMILEAKKQEQLEWVTRTYGKAQGLSYLDFAQDAALATQNGQLWFGVESEVLLVMDEPKADSVVPPAYITGMDIMEKPQLFNRPVLEPADTIWNTARDSFFTGDKFPVKPDYAAIHHIQWDSISGPFNMPVDLRLPYNQNFLTFHFTGSHLADYNKTRYRYILEGVDKNWSAITDDPVSENYRDLDPGDYVFKVAARGFNGLWSKPAEFEFTVLPPWWKTSWAWILYALSFAGLIWGFIKWRSKKLTEENLILEQKVTQRTTELSNSLKELKQTQNQLVQSEKMASLGELTAGIAHEIQNPLNFINNFSEVNTELIEELGQEIEKGNTEEIKAIAKDIKENEQKITHHGKRADAIVKGMLQHSRASTGQKEPTDINALADEYLRLSYHGLRAKDKSFNAKMQTDFDAGIGKINVVPQDLGRVLLNLFNNAFYAVMQKKNSAGLNNYEPTVSVITKKINGKTEIHVKDNGTGIPQKVADKIFQPFFTTKPTGQGTGLGLSLSYDIIKAHGGEIKVETQEGQGTTFIIQL